VNAPAMIPRRVVAYTERNEIGTLVLTCGHTMQIDWRHGWMGIFEQMVAKPMWARCSACAQQRTEE
jgi:hypothetical protein